MFENKIFIDLAAGLLLAAAIGSGAPRELRAQDGTHTATPCRAGDGCVQDNLRETSGSASETITGGVKVSQSAAADHGVPSERGRCPGAGAAPPDETISTVALRIGGSRSITVERTGVTTTAEGCTWHGVVRETGESALLMWWTDGRLSGVLGYRGRVYKIHNTGGEAHAVLESPPRNAPSGHPLRSFGETADPSGPVGRPTGGSEAPAPAAHGPRPAVPFTDAERHRLEAKRIVIDLMVLYTKKAASRYMMALQDLVAHAVEQTNVSFRNSGLENIRLRLVHTELVDYEETPGGHFDHLYHMVDGVGPFSDVRKLRDEKRADVVGLIAEDPSGCGLTTRIAPDPEEAYFVVHHSCAAIMISIAHEIGHVLGARHDPGTDALNSPFPYGHGYVNGTKWRDIMSYQQSCGGCPRIPHWSNPRILYKGEPTGTDANDNARVILEQAERVSRFR